MRCFEISNSKQVLRVVSVDRHFSNPRDPAVPLITRLFEHTEKQVSPDGLVAVIEHNPLPVPRSIEGAVKSRMEGGIVLVSADQLLVPTIRLEPPFPLQFAEMCSQFPFNEVVYYLLARTLWQYHDVLHAEPDFEQYFATQCKLLDSAEFEGKKITFDLALLKQTHEQLFGTALDLSDANWWREITLLSPVDGWQTRSNYGKVQRITKALVEYRDSYIMNGIVELWRAGLSQFILYHDVHAAVFERELPDLIRQHSPDVQFHVLDLEEVASWPDLPQRREVKTRAVNTTKMNLIKFVHGQPIASSKKQQTSLQYLLMVLLMQNKQAGRSATLMELHGRASFCAGLSFDYRQLRLPNRNQIDFEAIEASLVGLCEAGLCQRHDRACSLTACGDALSKYLNRISISLKFDNHREQILPMLFPAPHLQSDVLSR